MRCVSEKELNEIRDVIHDLNKWINRETIDVSEVARKATLLILRNGN
jgi:hypothetical protein